MSTAGAGPRSRERGPLDLALPAAPLCLGELAVPATTWRRRTDVVIVGTGGAGLSALRQIAPTGLRVDVITRAAVMDSATDWAQGGLAAVWDRSDTLDAHLDDTLVAGAGLCDPETVWDVVSSAPGAIADLARIGAEFDTDADGDYDLHREGGHSARRILHAGGDASGHEVERALAAMNARLLRETPRVSLHERTRLIDLLTDANGAVCGVRVLDANGTIGEIRAGAVVLAAGGAGQIWATTSNPFVATGDGIAAALRAGARVRDIEFMQFHPTLLALPVAGPDDRGVLISEAVRGEGAFLRDAAARLVMRDVHPLADLAPRDVVSAAMHAHMARYGLDQLLLDATAFGAQTWEHHFPSILRMCRERGVDPVVEPIPVRPGAHYMCGGIAADLDGRTSLPGLFAVGETASTGLHGANRLASNSLTETVIAGTRCGQLLAGAGAPATGRARRRAPLGFVAGEERSRIQHTMDAQASVSRSAAGLDAAATTLASLASTDACTPATLDATAIATVASAVVLAAAERTESRGCHRRSDFPATDAGWRRRLGVKLTHDGVEVATTPVVSREERRIA